MKATLFRGRLQAVVRFALPPKSHAFSNYFARIWVQEFESVQLLMTLALKTNRCVNQLEVFQSDAVVRGGSAECFDCVAEVREIVEM